MVSSNIDNVEIQIDEKPLKLRSQKEALEEREKRKKKYIDEIKEKPVYWIRKTLDLAHVGDVSEKITVTLLVIATYMKKISHVLLSGESSSGKTNLLNACLKFIEREDYLHLIGATDAGLRNAEELIDSKKALVFTEFDATKPDKDDSLAFMLRMLSASDDGGDYLKSVQVGGNWTAGSVRVKSKSVFTTFAKGTHLIGEENLNRMWILEPKQDQTQVKRVLNESVFQHDLRKWKTKAEFEFRTGIFREAFLPLIIERIKDVLTYNQKDKGKVEKVIEKRVVIPFENELGFMFRDVSETRAARDIDRFKTLIRIITLLHVSVDHTSRKYILTDNLDYDKYGEIMWYIAEPQDWSLACELSWITTRENILEITKTDIDIYKNMVEMCYDLAIKGDDWGKGVTVREVAQHSGIHYEYCRKRIKNLAAKFLIVPGNNSKNTEKRTYYWSPNEEFKAFDGWQNNIINIINSTQRFVNEQNIKKEFEIEKIYSIFERSEEIPNVIDINLKDLLELKKDFSEKVSNIDTFIK